MTPASQHPSAVADQAAAWFVRLQAEDCPERDWLAFTDWLEADPAHPAAYAAMEALWVDLDEAGTAPAAKALDNITILRPRPARPGWTPLAGWLGAATAIAAVALIVVLPARLAPPPAQTYQTAIGQSRVLTLADGSKIVLNSGTRLSLRLAAKERTAILEEGEAAFDVAHDPSRPFRIAAGGERVEVIGTEFDVLRHAGALTVTVRRGLVAVSPFGGQGGKPVLLPAGRQLHLASASATPVVSEVDPNVAFAWRAGRLIYRQARLSEVADDLSRYVSKPIRVEQAAADLRLTGVLNIDEETAMVRRLESFLPIKAEVTQGEIRLRPDGRQR